MRTKENGKYREGDDESWYASMRVPIIYGVVVMKMIAAIVDGMDESPQECGQ